jgi:hypothetical protein
MFRPKWPSSGVQVVAFQDSDAHCNAARDNNKHKRKKTAQGYEDGAETPKSSLQSATGCRNITLLNLYGCD